MGPGSGASGDFCDATSESARIPCAASLYWVDSNPKATFSLPSSEARPEDYPALRSEEGASLPRGFDKPARETQDGLDSIVAASMYTRWINRQLFLWG